MLPWFHPYLPVMLWHGENRPGRVSNHESDIPDTSFVSADQPAAWSKKRQEVGSSADGRPACLEWAISASLLLVSVYVCVRARMCVWPLCDTRVSPAAATHWPYIFRASELNSRAKACELIWWLLIVTPALWRRRSLQSATPPPLPPPPNPQGLTPLQDNSALHDLCPWP